MTALDPMNPQPLFRQLADLLRDRIDSGELQPGDQLPTQAQLVDEHGVSVSVVRDAVDLLRGEGRVESFRGKGVLVRTPPVRRRLSTDRYGTAVTDSAFVTEQGAEHADLSVDPRFGEAPVPAAVAAEFGIPTGAPGFRRQIVWRINGLPKRITDSWFPLDLVKGTPMTDASQQPWPGGVIAELRALGLRITSLDEDVIGRMPTPDEAYTLRIPGGTPLFIVTRVGRARAAARPEDKPRVVEMAEITLPCDRWGLHNRLDF